MFAAGYRTVRSVAQTNEIEMVQLVGKALGPPNIADRIARKIIMNAKKLLQEKVKLIRLYFNNYLYKSEEMRIAAAQLAEGLT